MSLLEELIRELEEKPHLARKLAEKLNATLSTEILSSIERLREDFNKMLAEISRIKREQRRMRETYESFRGSMLYGFSQLSKFTGPSRSP
jgi:predicted  nucleic acid-binding Zn-ribbon protein